MKKKNALKNNTDFKLLAGQKLIIGFDGYELNDDLKFLISELKIGGIVLFSRNIKSPSQLRTLINHIIEFAAISNTPKLFISIDQEGGVVARLKKPFKVFKGNPYIKNTKEAENFAKAQALELNKLKINMNFAPVLDVIPHNYKSIMEKRAFAGSAEVVSELGSKVITTMQKFNIMAVAKHFPGIGRTKLDSHFELPMVNRNINKLFSEELIPFENAVNIDVTGIMLSHILYPEIDSAWQASLSFKIAKELLREKMGFKGLIMTDDLDMKAIKHTIKTSAEQILKSDIDIALICHKGPDMENMFNEFKNLMENNKKLLGSAQKSLKRIQDTKKKYLTKKYLI